MHFHTQASLFFCNGEVHNVSSLGTDNGMPMTEPIFYDIKYLLNIALLFLHAAKMVERKDPETSLAALNSGRLSSYHKITVTE